MLGNGHVRFGGGLRGKGPAHRRHLAAQPTLRSSPPLSTTTLTHPPHFLERQTPTLSSSRKLHAHLLLLTLAWPASSTPGRARQGRPFGASLRDRCATPDTPARAKNSPGPRVSSTLEHTPNPHISP